MRYVHGKAPGQCFTGLGRSLLHHLLAFFLPEFQKAAPFANMF